MDVAIVGGGLAGSAAAAALTRAGIGVTLVDPHRIYPPDFRCEKLDWQQIAILKKTNVSDALLRVATPDRGLWVARRGRLIEKRRGAQVGAMYETMVNALRAEVPEERFIGAKAIDIAGSADRQTVGLSSGDQLTARLVVLANGLNTGFRQKLGMQRTVLSENHSITVGFDLKPLGRPAFDFSALTYYGETPSHRMAYLTLFPIGQRTRANLFVYRDLHDPWLKQLRDAPVETLRGLMPGLEPLIGAFEIAEYVKIRPVDLYVTQGYRCDGVVLIGDAFGTSCPAAGTGAGKAINDVERLCNVHIPRWLETPGMDAGKLASFYDDPAKKDYDAAALAKAFHLRSLSIDASARWQAERTARYAWNWTRGALKQMLSAAEPPPPAAEEPSGPLKPAVSAHTVRLQ